MTIHTPNTGDRADCSVERFALENGIEVKCKRNERNDDEIVDYQSRRYLYISERRKTFYTSYKLHILEPQPVRLAPDMPYPDSYFHSQEYCDIYFL